MSFSELKLETVITDREASYLTMAAIRGDWRQIDRLLTRGVDINYTGRHGITPLGWVLLSNRYDGFALLLDRGANPNLLFHERLRSVIHLAARHRDARFLIKALEKGGDPNLVDPGSKETSIFDAVEGGSVHHIKLLLDTGADPNHRDVVGETVLFRVVMKRDYETALLLLEHGLDPTLQDRRGNTVRDWVSKDQWNLDEDAKSFMAWISDYQKGRHRVVV